MSLLTLFFRIECGSGVRTSFKSVLCTRPPYASGLRTRWTCHCRVVQQNVRGGKRGGGGEERRGEEISQSLVVIIDGAVIRRKQKYGMLLWSTEDIPPPGTLFGAILFFRTDEGSAQQKCWPWKDLVKTFPETHRSTFAPSPLRGKSATKSA